MVIASHGRVRSQQYTKGVHATSAMCRIDPAQDAREVIGGQASQASARAPGNGHDCFSQSIGGRGDRLGAAVLVAIGSVVFVIGFGRRLAPARRRRD